MLCIRGNGLDVTVLLLAKKGTDTINIQFPSNMVPSDYTSEEMISTSQRTLHTTEEYLKVVPIEQQIRSQKALQSLCTLTHIPRS